MVKHFLIFIIISSILLFTVPSALGKYVICASDSVSYYVNVDDSYPSLTISDINGTIVNEGDIAITNATIKFSSNVAKAYYEYSISNDFNNSTQYDLENNSTLTQIRQL